MLPAFSRACSTLTATRGTFASLVGSTACTAILVMTVFDIGAFSVGHRRGGLFLSVSCHPSPLVAFAPVAAVSLVWHSASFKGKGRKYGARSMYNMGCTMLDVALLQLLDFRWQISLGASFPFCLYRFLCTG